MTMHLIGFDERTVVRPASTTPPPSRKRTRRKSLYIDVFKRGFDLVAVLITLPLVLFVILVLAAVVALDGGNPFYCQKRIGRNGRAFRMWKLRSMVPDADGRLEAYLAANPAAHFEWHHKQKLRDDPRITPVGRILRKTSLDELPQVFNVLNGTMSLVGPRPMMVGQQSQYCGSRYYELRPGLTGFWQISDRNDCGFAGRAKYDNAYFRAISFRTDLVVILRTVFVVLRGTGY